jgi:hypothetical protein
MITLETPIIAFGIRGVMTTNAGETFMTRQREIKANPNQHDRKKGDVRVKKEDENNSPSLKIKSCRRKKRDIRTRGPCR